MTVYSSFYETQILIPGNTYYILNITPGIITQKLILAAFREKVICGTCYINGPFIYLKYHIDDHLNLFQCTKCNRKILFFTTRPVYPIELVFRFGEYANG